MNLGDRGINRDGLKEGLVGNAYGVYRLDLPAEYTDAQTEENQVNNDYKRKLVLENGMVNLPDPRLLVEGWVCAPLNLPDTTYENVNAYLTAHDAGKAYKGGECLLKSNNVMGTNKTCTEKTQKWSIPSKKQMNLHTPEVLSEILISLRTFGFFMNAKIHTLTKIHDIGKGK